MPKNIFVTAIDTNMGKTITSAILVEALKADYWKPIQAGDLKNSDKKKVKKLVSNKKSQFHPEAYALKMPASPNISAAKQKVEIEIQKIQRPNTANNLVIEGAGGILVPINQENFIFDLMKKEDYIILVSQHYLGSINHTLLSLSYLQNHFSKIGLIFVGNKNKDSKKTILSFAKNVSFLGEISTLKEINPQQIQKQSKKIKKSLNQFLSTK
ncbi:MAG: dethiobiotin synthase [Flavobacteriaceae bacterium]|nr:MAG: dethiobiotin synthase [Flavobacteriaceae bacterium]